MELHQKTFRIVLTESSRLLASNLAEETFCIEISDCSFFLSLFKLDVQEFGLTVEHPN